MDGVPTKLWNNFEGEKSSSAKVMQNALSMFAKVKHLLRRADVAQLVEQLIRNQ